MTPLFAPWLMLLIGGTPAPANPMLAKLTGQGVVISPETTIKLPPPAMPDGLDADAQREVLIRLGESAKPKRSLKDLLRKSKNARFILRIESIDPGHEMSVARKIDAYFVAYARLEVALSEAFLKDLMNSMVQESRKYETSSGILKEKQMQARDLPWDDRADNYKEGYFYSSYPLFEKVYISATRHAVLTRGSTSVVAAAMLDDRFQGDREFPNRWSPITRDSLGRPQIGEPHDYAGAGFYLKATQLAEPEDALFIEYHQVFDEPRGWFDGRSVLRARLGLMASNAVETLREKLSRAEAASRSAASR